ncbi:hypothetical protein [Pseudonocardia nigra]|uniref:hypothetical protein n=1 Tax=Pseudonocardia nigra TaxID=1921578 RepID=UPI001C603BFF|nr:hypothetical protein [Pseudonocardia nigra]
MGELALLPSRRALRRLDALAVLTVLGFAAIGVAAGVLLADLARLGTGLGDVARSLDLAARGLSLLAEVPVVGEPAGRLSDSVAEAAGSVATTATEVRGSMGTLAVVVAVALALLPLPLVLGVYLPLRWVRHREVRGLRRLLAGPVDPTLVEHLARAAVFRIPYADLLRVTRSPWQDLDAGRHHRLAAAELHRLGVTAPRAWWEGAPEQPARPR